MESGLDTLEVSMTRAFDKDYWQTHWQGRDSATTREIPPNPYLAAETSELTPGTALDAGCGEGVEAIWLAGQGWRVTAADISAEALSRAGDRAAKAGADAVEWVEADLSAWEPGSTFDLVTTHYAHPAMPQLAFYQRISNWVAPGGTLLIVGHLHTTDTAHGHDHGPVRGHGQGHGHGQVHGHGNDQGHGHGDEHGQPPAEASVTAASIVESLDSAIWDVRTAQEQSRTLPNPAGGTVELHDVVVRASKRP